MNNKSTRVRDKFPLPRESVRKSTFVIPPTKNVGGIYNFLDSCLRRNDSYRIVSLGLYISIILLQVNNFIFAQDEFAPTNKDIENLKYGRSFSYYQIIIDRSPFYRKVAQEKETEPPEGDKDKIIAESGEKKDFKFIFKGTIKIGETVKAVLFEKSSSETYFAAKGEELSGYKVLDIRKEEVVLFKKDEGELILNLVK